MTGSEAQIKWAEEIRYALLARCRHAPGVVACMKTITQATWWLANKDRNFNTIRWPAAWAEDIRWLDKSMAENSARGQPGKCDPLDKIGAKDRDWIKNNSHISPACATKIAHAILREQAK